jgi:hypothetical protein
MFMKLFFNTIQTSDVIWAKLYLKDPQPVRSAYQRPASTTFLLEQTSQATVLFSQNKPAPAISHQSTEQAAKLYPKESNAWKSMIMHTLWTDQNISTKSGTCIKKNPEEFSVQGEKERGEPHPTWHNRLWPVITISCQESNMRIYGK